MANLKSSDLSSESIDSAEKSLTPKKIEEFIIHAIELQEKAEKNQQHLETISKMAPELEEFNEEIERKKRLETSLEKEIAKKNEGKNKLQLTWDRVFGSKFEEESLETVEGSRSSLEWHRDRKQDELDKHSEALILLQESVISSEDILNIIDRTQEEANIVQRIAKGIAIGKKLSPKDLDNFKTNTEAFMLDLSKRVTSGEIPPFEIEKEDYEQAGEIYKNLVTYISRARSNRKTFPAAASLKTQTDFLRPITHVTEGINSLVEDRNDENTD